MITSDDLENILTVYFEEVYQTKEPEKIQLHFCTKYTQESYESELSRLNSGFGVSEIVMGGGLGTPYWNPDRKIMICNGRKIGAAVWTNKPFQRITKLDKEIKRKIEKRWSGMVGYLILNYS